MEVRQVALKHIRADAIFFHQFGVGMARRTQLWRAIAEQCRCRVLDAMDAMTIDAGWYIRITLEQGLPVYAVPILSESGRMAFTTRF